MGWWERKDGGRTTSERDSRDTAHPVCTQGCLSGSLAVSPADSRAGGALRWASLEELWAVSHRAAHGDVFISVYLASVGPAGWALQWGWAPKLGAPCMGGGLWERAESQRWGAPPRLGQGAWGKGIESTWPWSLYSALRGWPAPPQALLGFFSALKPKARITAPDIWDRMSPSVMEQESGRLCRFNPIDRGPYAACKA